MSADRIQCFALGAASALIVSYLVQKLLQPSQKQDSCGRTPAVADDNCNSLFYDILPEDKKGVGFTDLKTTPETVLQQMRTVHPDYSRLPFALYKQIVEALPIVCVDVICRRQDGKLLLFYRRDKPAASIWWWPGGRMFRGETFFDAAIRKVRDETGQKDAVVTPTGVVNVWNTFFPDSHWDAERAKGREGTQTVNIVVVCDIVWTGLSAGTIAEGSGGQAGGNSEWAVEAHRWVTPEEAVERGRYDKYVSGNVTLARSMKLL